MPRLGDPDLLRERSEQLLQRLRGPSDEDIAQARDLVLALRNARLYPQMAALAEALGRRAPDDARTRRLYGQALIEQGYATAAIDVLQPLAARLPHGDPEHAEATGLLGRAWKQIFFDAGDKTTASAIAALRRAIDVYRRPFEADPAVNTWHGVNLVALLTRARRLGLRLAPGLRPDRVARRVLDALDAIPVERRDEWHLPTRAEAALGLGEWSVVEAALKAYVADANARAFQIASTLRQFTQVWDIEVDARGRSLADILRARLLEVGGGELTLGVQALQQARERAAGSPPAAQLEAVLGAIGAKTWQWWKAGMNRAAGVAVVRSRLGERIGTGWLVRAADLGLSNGAELLAMTNFHVVNAQGANNALAPGAAELVFEAVDGQKAYALKEIVWSSAPDRHDCTLLRLAEAPTGIDPLPLARSLPAVDSSAHVYVIGYPGGRGLAFSLQDNALIDHEGPPAGKPAIEGVCRVHYRAPTEGGSSGSPVFDASAWEVIALHHAGGRLGMPRLNGQAGTYAANEGVGIGSIVAALAAVAPVS